MEYLHSAAAPGSRTAARETRMTDLAPDMNETQLRRYLGEILPALADLADAMEAPDLGEAAFTLRLLAHKVALLAASAPVRLRLVS